MQAPLEHVDTNFQILAHLFWICIKLTSSPLVDNVWINVKMQKYKTKHINIYVSFSNRPNLVSKARNETKITYMNHSRVKALPQVIYENTSTWQGKIFRLRKFYQKKARFTCKSLSMSHLSHKHAYHSEIIQGYQILNKRSL
jgi:hypothetical protein